MFHIRPGLPGPQQSLVSRYLIQSKVFFTFETLYFSYNSYNFICKLNRILYNVNVYNVSLLNDQFLDEGKKVPEIKI